MTLAHARSQSRAPRRPRSTALYAGIALAALIPLTLAVATRADAADTPVDLGTAKAFSVLAGSGVTNTGVTNLAGSLGSYETPTVTTDTPFVFTGADASNHAGDGVTQQAKSDLLTAYNTVAGALPPTAIPQELSRTDPYLPGIYRASSSLLLTGAMTLDGGGRNDGVFIFQAPSSTLTTASNSTVLFVNGAQPCNVYWQVGSSATFGTGTTFVGNVLAHTTITAGTNAIFQGRLLANNGAVNLDSNTITNPGCAAATDDDGTPSPGVGTPTPTPAPTSTAAPTPAPTATASSSPSPTRTPATPGDDADDDSDAGPGTDRSRGTGTGTGVDISRGGDTDRPDTRLPDAGGPPLILLIVGVMAVAGGIALIRLNRIRGSHREES